MMLVLMRQTDEDDDNNVAYAPALYLEDKSADPAQLIENQDFETDSNARLDWPFGL